MKTTTNLFSISTRDLLKGFITAMLTVLIGMLYVTIDAGHFPLDWNEWRAILLPSFAAGLAYLMKNFLTNSKDQFMKKEVMAVLLLVMFSFSASADTIRDSSDIHNAIVNTVNPIVNAIPDATPTVSLFKAIILSIGSALTGIGITLFAKRKKK